MVALNTNRNLAKPDIAKIRQAKSVKTGATIVLFKVNETVMFPCSLYMPNVCIMAHEEGEVTISGILDGVKRVVTAPVIAGLNYPLLSWNIKAGDTVTLQGTPILQASTRVYLEADE